MSYSPPNYPPRSPTYRNPNVSPRNGYPSYPLRSNTQFYGCGCGGSDKTVYKSTSYGYTDSWDPMNPSSSHASTTYHQTSRIPPTGYAPSGYAPSGYAPTGYAPAGYGASVPLSPVSTPSTLPYGDQWSSSPDSRYPHSRYPTGPIPPSPYHYHTGGKPVPYASERKPKLSDYINKYYGYNYGDDEESL